MGLTWNRKATKEKDEVLDVSQTYYLIKLERAAIIAVLSSITATFDFDHPNLL
jgi:hypothetical protein